MECRLLREARGCLEKRGVFPKEGVPARRAPDLQLRRLLHVLKGERADGSNGKAGLPGAWA